MVTIIGIAGSLRTNSYNRGLLRAAADVMPEESFLEICTIEDIPLYNGDIEENQGIPHQVTTLKDKIVAADGLLIITPEYNNSIPGVLKNAIDWLSRPPADRPMVFGNLPVGIIGTTPGNFGTAFSQYAWLPIMRTLSAQVWNGKLLWVSSAMSKFDKAGNLQDKKTRDKLSRYMHEYVDFVRKMTV